MHNSAIYRFRRFGLSESVHCLPLTQGLKLWDNISHVQKKKGFVLVLHEAGNRWTVQTSSSLANQTIGRNQHCTTTLPHRQYTTYSVGEPTLVQCRSSNNHLGMGSENFNVDSR
eukprot:2482389-Amphidinium_carterae.1